MGCESAAFIKKARKVYFSLEDEESREIFRKKFLYMITGEDKYWLQIIMNRDPENYQRLEVQIPVERYTYSEINGIVIPI